MQTLSITALAMAQLVRGLTPKPSPLSMPMSTALGLLPRSLCRDCVNESAGRTKHTVAQAGAVMPGDGDIQSHSSPLGRGREVFSLAPMMDYTDRHMRYLLRLLTKRTVLWTEMVPAPTIKHNPDDLDRFLAYNQDVEHPVVLQIGGSDTNYVRAACELARPYKYDAINLNCGCPSDKVAGKGAFGAALMRSPSLVADLCLAMREGAGGDVPITVKHRIGVDNEDSYEQLAAFVDQVHRVGDVQHFIVHARKAILGGLSPAQNRSVPPLKHDFVFRLAKDFPQLDFTLNGGINTYEEVIDCLEQGAHGVMVGRSWTGKPWYWSQADSRLFGAQDPGLTRREVLEIYGSYGEQQEQSYGEQWLSCRRKLAKPVWHLFHGEKGGKKFRVALENSLRERKPFGDILRKALQALPEDQIDWRPGENWESRRPIGAVATGATAEDVGCAASTRVVADGRYRDGRLVSIKS